MTPTEDVTRLDLAIHPNTSISAALLAPKQDGDVTLNLAAAAEKLEALGTEQPCEKEVAATPPPTAEVAPGDIGTPWTKEVVIPASIAPQKVPLTENCLMAQIEHEASAFAKLLAAASRSVTPSSPQSSPQRLSAPSRCAGPMPRATVQNPLSK